MGFTKEQFNDYQRRRYRDRMDYAIRSLGGVCVKCGGAENLELDHIDPDTKKANISSMHMYRWDRFLEELAKTQLLCKPCHVDKTQGSYPQRQHGTRTMYKRGSCRCDACKAAMSVYARELRMRKQNLERAVPRD